jgi:hypothetical protein
MARSRPIRRERIGRPLRDHDDAVTELAPLSDDYLAPKRRHIGTNTVKGYRYSLEPYCRWLADVGLPVTVSSHRFEQLEVNRPDFCGGSVVWRKIGPRQSAAAVPAHLTAVSAGSATNWRLIHLPITICA